MRAYTSLYKEGQHASPRLAGDRDAGLLVLGPDRSRIPGRRFRAVARRVRRDAPCLVWVAPDG
jgi:hypothetical protein